MNCPKFVSTDWLHQHLNSSEIQVIDARLLPPGLETIRDIHGEYTEQHLPQAVYFDIEALSCQSVPYPHMLTQPAIFAEAMCQLGIDSSKHLVVYDEGTLFSAPRAAYMFLLLGVKRVSILSGGLRAWHLAGYPLASGPVQLPASQFQPHFNAGAIVNLAQIQQLIIDQQTTIIDARPAPRYLGHVDEPRPGLRRGHIPGSYNLPWQELVADGRLLDHEKLVQRFAAAAIPLHQPFVVYCGSGVTAMVVFLALQQLGYNSVQLYDGSWSEWGSRDDLPLSLVAPQPPDAPSADLSAMLAKDR